MSNHFDTDVLIVGGGPAGASTALSLLRYSNLKVMIVEQGDFDHIRVGEQVNPSIFDLLKYLDIDRADFDPQQFIQGYSSAAAWGSDRLTNRESIFSTQEASYQLDREQFDLYLLKEAGEKGAVILPRTRCTQFKQLDNNYWQTDLKHLSQGDFSVQSKYLIDATGRHANVSRKLNVGTMRHDQLTAIGTFFQFDDTAILPHDILLESFRDGWWYCATLPQQKVTVTLFTDADIAKEKQITKAEQWQSLLAQTTHIKSKLFKATGHGDIWVRNAFSQVSNSIEQDHFIAVGDAAASFDPISSMGIGFAITSACHAAKAIIEFDAGNELALAHYQENINQIFTNYLDIKSQFYAKEKRWQESLFWQRRVLEPILAHP